MSGPLDLAYEALKAEGFTDLPEPPRWPETSAWFGRRTRDEVDTLSRYLWTLDKWSRPSSRLWEYKPDPGPISPSDFRTVVVPEEEYRRLRRAAATGKLGLEVARAALLLADRTLNRWRDLMVNLREAAQTPP